MKRLLKEFAKSFLVLKPLKPHLKKLMMKIISRIILLGLLMCPPAFASETDAYEVIIKDAFIYDGIKPTGFYADVGILGDQIAWIGDIDERNSSQVIDATGLILTPGFIDVHTHSDFNPLIYEKFSGKVTQGVTTEIAGNCGMSAAPIHDLHKKEISGVWAREGVTVPKEINWSTFSQYKQTLKAKGLVNNVGALVGHGNLRSSVMGMAPGQATEQQVNEMKTMLTQSMKNGALGISYGLVYLPGLFANAQEITELCRVAGELGAFARFIYEVKEISC